MAGRWEIIIHGELWLNKEFPNKIFAAKVQGQRQRLKIELVIQVNVFRTVQYVGTVSYGCTVST